MEAACFPKTLLSAYKIAQYHNPEDQIFIVKHGINTYLHNCEITVHKNSDNRCCNNQNVRPENWKRNLQFTAEQ
jgi:hypothetical protein